MAQLIESVCTANYGRSEPSRLLFQSEIERLGLTQEFIATSSGTKADELVNGPLTKGTIKYLMSLALKRNDVFKGDAYKQAKAIVERADFDYNTGLLLYQHANNIFHHEEHAFREEALKLFGIEGQLKDAQDQTIARPDTAAVLFMAGSNLAAGEEIYSEGHDNGIITTLPVLDTLSRYANRDSSSQIPNAYGGTKQEYFNAIAQIKEAVPKALERIANEIL
jgi:protein-tyrosine-phosphatase